MSRRKRKGVHKNKEQPGRYGPPDPALVLHDADGTRHVQYGTHRTPAMEDARARRIAKLRAFTGSKFDQDPDLCPAERPCARGTFGCSVNHRTGWERCETW